MMQKGPLIPFSAEDSFAENAEGAGPDPTKSFTIRSMLKRFALLLPKSFQN